MCSEIKYWLNIRELKLKRKKLIKYMLFRYIVQSQKLTQKVQDTLDEDKLKKMAISDYKKKKTEIDTNFRVQQNLCEAVQRDRNTLNKQLLQAQVKQC